MNKPKTQEDFLEMAHERLMALPVNVLLQRLADYVGNNANLFWGTIVNDGEAEPNGNFYEGLYVDVQNQLEQELGINYDDLD